MKSPGPFYQYADGHFHADDTAFDHAAYLQALHGVPVFEVTGGIDFPAISARVAALLTPTATPRRRPTMTRELMLLRHAKSDWTTDVDDIDRPITDPGKRGVQRLGVWLAQQSLQPDFVISSPAERAWITTEKTIKAMGRGIDERDQGRAHLRR